MLLRSNAKRYGVRAPELALRNNPEPSPDGQLEERLRDTISGAFSPTQYWSS